MSPLVSLIIPCRNHGEVLPGLLRSVASQSIAAEMEILIVDDCSDIPCTAAARAFPDLNIRVIRPPERVYMKGARLLGMEAAQGEVIAFADADDLLWGTEALEKNVRLLREAKADIVHFPCVEVNADYLYLREHPSDRPLAPVLEGKAIFSALVRQGIRGRTVWSRLYSRHLALKILEAARPVRVRNGREDVMFNLLFFLHARKYVTSPHTGYAWCAKRRNQVKSWRWASSSWYMLHDLVPYIEAHGTPAHETALLRQDMRTRQREQMRLFCKDIIDEYPRLTNSTVEHLLADADFESAARIWMETPFHQ